MSQTVVLITGARRGLGKKLVTHYLECSNTTVIAGLRDLSNASSQDFHHLSRGSGSVFIPMKLDSASPTDATNAVSVLRSEHRISHIDIVIANAGICEHFVPVAEIDLAEVHRHLDTNTWGLLRLFQATWPLLQKSASPKLIYMSSRLSSISLATKDPVFTGTYGLSKAAGNYLIAKIASENPDLVAFSINPGLVQTDMGNRGAQYLGLEQAPVTLKDSIEWTVVQIARATRQNTIGKFWCYGDTTIAW